MSGADLPVSVNGMAAFELDLASELALYQHLGVGAVGLPAVKLAARGWDRSVEQVRAAGVRVDYLFTAFTCDPADEAGWSTQVAAVSEALVAGRRLGVHTLYFTTGPSGQMPWERAAEVLGRRLAPAVALAADLGITLAVENTLSIRSDISFVHSVADALVLAEALGIGLCVDLYCAWQERDLLRTFTAAADRVRLVQVADFKVGTLSLPNRWVPGDGDLPLSRLLGEIVGTGYRGLVDLELTGPEVGRLGTENALRQGMDWLTAQLAPLRDR